jgi:hypothetical protein
LRKLVERFSPETTVDTELIRAFFVTLFWGGEPGARPGWIFTSKDGRGVGKTKLATMGARLSGGLFDVAHNEDMAGIKKRLLTPDALTKRTALVDNVKTTRFSWADAESLITARDISGHQMYVGESSRPNTLTWLFTINGPAASKDVAQRCVQINLSKPIHDPTWEEETNRLIDHHKWQIIGDIAALFQSPAPPLARVSRWGSWERDVLARLNDPPAIQAVVRERQKAIDADDEEAAHVEEFFHAQLERLGYDTESESVHIPNAIAARWFSEATNSRHSPTATTRAIRQASDEGIMRRLAINPCRANGRGVLWIAEGFAGTVLYDLPEKLEQRRILQGERWT